MGVIQCQIEVKFQSEAVPAGIEITTSLSCGCWARAFTLCLGVQGVSVVD